VLFSKLYKIVVNKVTFEGFSWGIAPPLFLVILSGVGSNVGRGLNQKCKA